MSVDPYEAQLDECIQLLHIELDKAAKIRHELGDAIDVKFDRCALIHKWRPMTKHIKSDKHILECTIELECAIRFFNYHIEKGNLDKRIPQLIMPCIARKYG